MLGRLALALMLRMIAWLNLVAGGVTLDIANSFEEVKCGSETLYNGGVVPLGKSGTLDEVQSRFGFRSKKESRILCNEAKKQRSKEV